MVFLLMNLITFSEQLIGIKPLRKVFTFNISPNLVESEHTQCSLCSIVFNIMNDQAVITVSIFFKKKLVGFHEECFSY